LQVTVKIALRLNVNSIATPMKTLVTLGLLVLGTHLASAQNIVLAGGLPPATQAGGGVQGATPTTVATAAPAPVMYQPSPVVYQAPQVVSQPVYAPPVGYYSSPNVIYFGPPGGYQWNVYSRYGSYCGSHFNHTYHPNVIHFGRGESFYRGYHFGRCR
jgi:hypothetical protein